MKRDATALVWGLIFAAVAALGLWTSTGHTVVWHHLSIGAPIVLITIGVLGLLFSRTSQRRSPRRTPASARSRKEPL